MRIAQCPGAEKAIVCQTFFQKMLDNSKLMWYNFKVRKKITFSCKEKQDLGVAQLGARYLGVVEAASSSLVTQTSILNKMHKK